MTEHAKILEIACFDLVSAELAAAAGADRIELCENYVKGGLTPLNEIILSARERIKIPLHVMIRPRGGDFTYGSAELEVMRQQILFCKESGIDGVVFGVLTKKNDIDRNACRKLKSEAGPMQVTFHRAIDQCVDLDKSLKLLIDLGIERVLTSGGSKNAADHIPNLEVLQKIYGGELIIVPGGGVRSMNIQQLLETGCHEFHSAAITGQSLKVDVEEIKKLRKVLTIGS